LCRMSTGNTWEGRSFYQRCELSNDVCLLSAAI
jgi:hypothetical protein